MNLLIASTFMIQNTMFCGPRDSIMSHLLDVRKQSVIAMAIGPTKMTFLEVLRNENGDFTIVTSDQAGNTCYLANGFGYITVEEME